MSVDPSPLHRPEERGVAESARPTEVCVLDSGDVARAVATAMGCGVRPSLPVAGEPPVLVVVAEDAEVAALADVEDRWWVAAVVAWMLPEASVVRLHELGVPVVVGLPSVDEVVRRMDYPLESSEAARELALAERLATVESLVDRLLGSD